MMNKAEKMCYKGYSFETNPSLIKIKHRALIAKNAVPFGSESVSDLGRKACEISGEGFLVGDDCEEQLAELCRLFLKGGSGLLLLPGIEPFYAFFESLEVLDEPSDELIKYSFSFREDTAVGHFKLQMPESTEAESGETLWDIAYKNKLIVEELMEKNPSIMRPDLPLEEGELIWL